jgi:hypothetical protein
MACEECQRRLLHSCSEGGWVSCASLTQPVGGVLDVEYRPVFLETNAFVLEHSTNTSALVLSVRVSLTSRLCARPRPRPGSTPGGFWRRGRSGCRSAGRTRRCPVSACCPNMWSACKTYASSNSRESLRNAFLHFLQTKVISKLCISSWSAASWWHSAQSNHLRPEQVSDCLGGYVKQRARTARRADGDLGVEDVLAAEHQRRSCVAGLAARAYHMARRSEDLAGEGAVGVGVNACECLRMPAGECVQRVSSVPAFGRRGGC